MVTRGQGGTGKTHKGTLGSDPRVLDLDCGDSYTRLYVFPNSSNGTLTMGTIFIYKLYLNKVDFKIKLFPGE